LHIPGLTLITIDHQGGIQFVDQVKIGEIRVEDYMTRAGTRPDVDLAVRRKLPFDQIEMVDQELIGTQVGREHKVVCRIWQDAVGVRLILPPGIDTGTTVRDHCGRWPELPVWLDGKHRNVPARVIGYKSEPSCPVDAYVARVFAGGGPGVQQ